MGYNELMISKVRQVFNLIGNLAINVTLTQKAATSYDFAEASNVVPPRLTTTTARWFAGYSAVSFVVLVVLFLEPFFPFLALLIHDVGNDVEEVLVDGLELVEDAREAGLEVDAFKGMTFNPITGRYSLNADTDVNYLMACRKPE